MEKKKILRQALSLDYNPEKYAKIELARKQISLHGIMLYAVYAKDPELLEACYETAKEYVWQKGYAQEPVTLILEQIQNTHESIEGVIAELRIEKAARNHPVTGRTTQKQAKKLLFEQAKKVSVPQ